MRFSPWTWLWSLGTCCLIGRQLHLSTDVFRTLGEDNLEGNGHPTSYSMDMIRPESFPTLSGLGFPTFFQDSMSNATVSSEPSVEAEFVFFIGLEGTGHHFLRKMLKKSPMKYALAREYEVLAELPVLQSSLFHHRTSEGLWNAHCKDWETASSEQDNTTADMTPFDLQILEDRAVDAMKMIAGQVAEKSAVIGESSFRNNHFYSRHVESKNILTVPINAFGGSDGYGMVSYPNYRGRCRTLNYPSMDLWYNACDKAQVRCRHIYIARKPLSILKSTIINRPHNRQGFLRAIHLYRSYLHLIISEMTTHSHRTVGCLSLLEGTSSWWEEVRTLGGWTNVTEYETYMKEVYKPRSSNATKTNSTKSGKYPDWLPLSVVPYLEAYEKVHNATQQLCEKSRDRNLGFESTEKARDSETESIHIQRNQSLVERPTPRVEFVLVIGLEGVETPTNMQALRTLTTGMDQLVLEETRSTDALQKLLYDPMNHTGLFNAHCNDELDSVDVAGAEQNVANVLRQLNSDLLEKLSKNSNATLTIPVNVAWSALRSPAMTIERNFTFATHPSSDGSCQKLDYPSLDLWYGACQRANLSSCRHAYVFSRPDDVVENYLRHPRPTYIEENRESSGRANGVVAFFHMYKTLLHILASELVDYGENAMACLNLTTSVETPCEGCTSGTAVNETGAFNESAELAQLDVAKLKAKLGPYYYAFEVAYHRAAKACHQSPSWSEATGSLIKEY